MKEIDLFRLGCGTAGGNVTPKGDSSKSNACETSMFGSSSLGNHLVDGEVIKLPTPFIFSFFPIQKTRMSHFSPSIFPHFGVGQNSRLTAHPMWSSIAIILNMVGGYT